jgi:hypothetical protein
MAGDLHGLAATAIPDASLAATPASAQKHLMLPPGLEQRSDFWRSGSKR